MAWVYANTGEDYDGPVHEIGRVTYSGATRTRESRRLIEVPDAPQPPSKPKVSRPPRPKQPPKPKGATAWD